MAFTPITVTGSWRKPGPDGGELPSSGQVTFQLYQALSDDSETILPRSRVVVQLDDAGDISVILAATTDPTTTPAGVPYEVVELVDKVQRRYFVEIPHDAPGGTVDLATLQPMTPLPPAVDPARIPPDPTGQTDGLVVTVENGVYVLQPAASGGYTGPINIDLSGATPDGDGVVAVDLSAMNSGVTTVTVSLPSWPSPVTALITPPPTDRGAFGLLVSDLTGTTIVSIAISTGIGPLPIGPPSIGAASRILYPITMPTFGDLWYTLPLTYGDFPTPVLTPTNAGTEHTGITGDVTLSAVDFQPTIVFDDGAVSNVTFDSFSADRQVHMSVILYNGSAGSGGTIAISLNGSPWPRASDIPVGSARLFQLVVAKAADNTVTVFADHGLTIPSDSPDY